MKRINTTSSPPRLAALLAGAVLLGLVSQSALAVNSNTLISNTATLDYDVGGVAQTAITSAAASFRVDKLVNVTVAELSGTVTSVSPGQTGAVTAFTVTNTGNDPQDIMLAGAEVASAQTLFAAVDNFDTAGLSVFVDVNNNGTYEPLTDIDTHINALAPLASKTVFILADIPVAQVNGDDALVSLLATVMVNDGAATLGGALPANAVTNDVDPLVVDTVYGDTVAGSDDAALNAAHSARDAYSVSSAIISVSKTATLLCDPVNGNTNPKNIPGATVQYTITISNAVAATASATLATIADTLDTANITFEPNLVTAASACATAEDVAGNGFRVVSGGTSTRASTAAVYFSSANDADGVEHNAGAVSAALGTALPVEVGYTAGELKPGEDVAVTFNVTVN